MIAAVLPYARGRLEALGLTEWIDGFNAENIPSTQLDNTFMVDLGTITTRQMNQTDLVLEVPFIVTIFKSVIRDNNQRIDDAISSADSVIDEMLKVSNRLNQSVTGDYLKDVKFSSMAIEPLNATDDNGVVVKMEFRAILMRCTA